MPSPLSRSAWKIFLLLDRIGVHILPKHYYTPIPDYHWLRQHREAWMGRAALTGVGWDLDQQVDWLAQVCHPYYHEVAGLDWYNRASGQTLGPGFGAVEAQVLHCFIRSQTPPRIVEIGSGVSTMCMLNALGINQQENRSPSEVVCVEPYPSEALRKNRNITLIEQPCQTVPSTVFAQLRAGDLLFIDSSHALKLGSDVVRIYMDIIPNLSAGVFIHIHDIFLPYLYPRAAMSYPFGSQETALLLALLTNNEHLSVLASLSALHYDRTQELARIASDYRPQANFEGLAVDFPGKGHFPNSLWLRTA
jgi:predicted O-methyltransferase YrrM